MTSKKKEIKMSVGDRTGSSPFTPQFKSKLSTELHKLGTFTTNPSVSIGGLCAQMHERSHAVFIVVLVIPFLLPVPMMGLSTVFGSVMILSGIRMFMGKGPWVPAFVGKRNISSETFTNMLRGAEKIVRRYEKWIRPRGAWFVNNPALRRLNGLLIAYAAFLLALPSPPGLNAPPASAILLLSLGTLEDDGLLLVLGYVSVVINTLLFGLLAYLGVEGYMALQDRILKAL